MIKAIIFDCFGVLTNDSWVEFLQNLPNDVDIDAVRQVHREYDSNKISKEESSKKIKALTGRKFVEIDDVITSQVDKNSRLLGYIKSLKSLYKTAIMSNIASNWVRDDFLTESEKKLFDEMFFSFEIGLIKPDPKFFEIVLNKLHVKPDEAVIIDDKERYCDVARQQGMKAVVYKNFEQMKSELEELLAIKG